jgi:hypothetical protein
VLPAKRAYKPGGNEIARLNLETARRFQRGPNVEGQDELEYEDQEMDAEYESDVTKRMRYE